MCLHPDFDPVELCPSQFILYDCILLLCMFDAEARLEHLLIGFVVVQNVDTCQSHFLLLTNPPVSKASIQATMAYKLTHLR